MRWKGRARSRNVEDRRGGRGVAVGGGVGMLILILIALVMGADPMALLDAVGPQQPGQQPGQQVGAPAADDDTREFIEVVLHDTEQVWGRLFAQHVEGRTYENPKLVLFSDSVRSGCGPASAAVGPFYCPADRQIYVPPAFFDDLARRHRAPGDFAQAYVIAHEVAHHVQNLLGYSQQVAQVRRQGSKLEANRASVRLELQADYLAGVWAHHAQRAYDILEEGDIQEALTAANQIGDDTLQRQAQGYVVPERYTHGTSKQRVRWFRAGLESGDFLGAERLFELDYEQL